MKQLVIIPTYDESENIRDLITVLINLDNTLEILIVDDNSPDGTAEIVEEMMKDIHRIHILKRAGKLGLGSAYVEGFKFAIQNKYDIIYQMDADFSHDPKVILEMQKEIRKYDVVIGSRYVSGINVVNWPMSRLILSYGAAQYVKIITGMFINDPTGGFKCLRREVLESIDLDNIVSDGYSFQIEMNFKAWNKGFNIKEIPIVFTDRRSGESKMSKRIIHEAIKVVWLLKFRQITGRL